MGHIFFIAPTPDTNLDEISEWTLYWLLEHNLVPDTAIYNCHSVRQALSAIEAPLSLGEAPAIVVIDHSTPPHEEIIKFASQLRSCIPESWILEVVPDDMPMPDAKENAFWVRKPVCKEDWLAVLDHVFFKAATPQWSASEK